MHDLRFIRENRDDFARGLSRRGLDGPALADEVLALDEQRREVLTRLQEMQQRRNEASKLVGKAKAAKDEAGAQGLIDEVAQLKDALQAAEEEARGLEDRLNGPNGLLATIPNIPLAGVPDGADEHGNLEYRRHGEKPELGFDAKEHFDIGEALGLMDFETAAKLSGARFVVLKGPLARLERALGQFMLDLHTAPTEGDLGGYTEIDPPILVRDEAMFGTAQLPKFEEDQFQTARTVTDVERSIISTAGEMEQAMRQGSLWLIPTAEVPLTNLVRESILDAATLPRRYTALTPSFRAEAGAAGRDTRGMIRQHQFHKVELVSITEPEASLAELERMLSCAEEVLKRLKLPYRVMTLCTGDMGFAARKTYDIEVWLPGQGAYREISSCSACGEFQARRMNARYRSEGEKSPRYVHTLNGSGVAVGRALIAVLENYQTENGGVRVPDALKPYMGGIDLIEPAKANG